MSKALYQQPLSALTDRTYRQLNRFFSDLLGMAAAIVGSFRERAFDSGDGFLEVILKGVTSAPKEEQDNRLY